MNLPELEYQPHPSIRGQFVYEIHRHMVGNGNIWVITGDLGWGMWDRVSQAFPDRFINVGAAEQAMVGVGVGLALEGKIPIVYSITPFLLYRPFETIRNYVNREQIPVKLVGSGRDRDYQHDGFSHWAEEDRLLFETGDSHQTPIWPNIKAYWPDTKEELVKLVPEVLFSGGPAYINLKR